MYICVTMLNMCRCIVVSARERASFCGIDWTDIHEQSARRKIVAEIVT
jgi:hypothetical protein